MARKNQKSVAVVPKPSTIEISPEIINKAIEVVKKKNFLGSSNKAVNLSGGLNGYFINLSRTILKAKLKGKVETPVQEAMAIYLFSAGTEITGAGNCGELTAALLVELYSQDLNEAQRRLIYRKAYATKDEHLSNSYLQVGDRIYDIWANRTYLEKRLKAETGVAANKHYIEMSLDPRREKELTIEMHKLVSLSFQKDFDIALAADRQSNHIYPTLDKTDPSDYALWATDSFKFLAEKFEETLTESYSDYDNIARENQKKIIKIYQFLMEELRQDVELMPAVKNIKPARIKYEETEVNKALKENITNDFFADYIIARSFDNTNPEKAQKLLQELKQRLPENSSNKLEQWISEAIPAIDSIIMIERLDDNHSNQNNNSNKNEAILAANPINIEKPASNQDNVFVFFQQKIAIGDLKLIAPVTAYGNN